MRLSRQALKRQWVRRDHVAQRIDEQIRAAPAVEPERHFLKVGGKMLCRDLMPRAQDSALQERERRFNAIRSHVAIDVDSVLVADRFVGRFAVAGLRQRVGVDAEFIGHNDFHICANVVLDVLRQGAALHVFRLEEPEFATALLNAKNRNLCLFSGVDSLPVFFPPT